MLQRACMWYVKGLQQNDLLAGYSGYCGPLAAQVTAKPQHTTISGHIKPACVLLSQWLTCDVKATENSRMTPDTTDRANCTQNANQPYRRMALVALAIDWRTFSASDGETDAGADDGGADAYDVSPNDDPMG